MVVSVVFVVTLEAEIEDLVPDLMKLTRATAEAARKTVTSTAGGFTRTARELERRRQTVTDQLTADPVLRCPSTRRAPDLDPISLAEEPPWLKSSQSKIRSAARLIRALLHLGTHRAKFADPSPAAWLAGLTPFAVHRQRTPMQNLRRAWNMPEIPKGQSRGLCPS